MAAAMLHYLANVALAPALFAAIHRSRIHIVDAEIESALDDGHGHSFIVGLLDGGLSTETEDARPMAGAPEITSRHGSGGRGIKRGVRCSRRRCCRRVGEQTAGQRSGGYGSGGFQKIATGSGGVVLIILTLAHGFLPMASS